MVLLPATVAVQWTGHARYAHEGPRAWHDPASDKHPGHDHEACIILQHLLATQAPSTAVPGPPISLSPTTNPPTVVVPILEHQVKHYDTWPRGPPLPS